MRFFQKVWKKFQSNGIYSKSLGKNLNYMGFFSEFVWKKSKSTMGLKIPEFLGTPKKFQNSKTVQKWHKKSPLIETPKRAYFSKKIPNFLTDFNQSKLCVFFKFLMCNYFTHRGKCRQKSSRRRKLAEIPGNGIRDSWKILISKLFLIVQMGLLLNVWD